MVNFSVCAMGVSTLQTPSAYATINWYQPTVIMLYSWEGKCRPHRE